MTKENEITSTQLAETAVLGLKERKGKEIKLLDLRDISNSVSDYFVICHGSSNTNVASLADSVQDEVREHLAEKPWHVEGTQNAEWIIIDYFNVVVHIFQESVREFYNLEDLWADAKVSTIED
jgi:ribosome-associated protein